MSPKSNLIGPVKLTTHSYLFSHPAPDGRAGHRVSANRAEDGPAGHVAVAFFTDEVAVETLINVAGWKAHAQRTFVDILHTVFSSRHDSYDNYSCLLYRVIQQVSHLGWGELDLGCSNILPGKQVAAVIA